MAQVGYRDISCRFMRQVRLLREFDPGRGVSIATLEYEYAPGHVVPDHAHGSDQFIYALGGVMQVYSDQSVWLIPPTFAIWVPARTRHRIRMTTAVSMRTLFVRSGLVKRVDRNCAVLSVSALLRELALETVRIGQLRRSNPEHCALRDLTALQIARATAVQTEVQMPREGRALAAATMILNTLADSPSIQAICSKTGVSTRTLQRLFKKDLGVDVATWRRHVRLTRALEFLITGRSVKEIACIVGYKQASAFVASLRRVFGVTPKIWAQTLREK